MKSRSVVGAMSSATIVARLGNSRTCADSMKSQVSRATVARAVVEATRIAATPISAIVVDRQDIEGLVAAAVVANEDM